MNYLKYLLLNFMLPVVFYYRESSPFFRVTHALLVDLGL